MRARAAIFGALIFGGALSACGDKLVHRPLILEIQGVSRLAEVLVVAVFPKSAARGCAEVSLGNVQELGAPVVARWVRSEGMAREIQLPSVDEDELTVVVYTENAEGKAIQFACTEVTYGEIEEGRVALRLSTVTASIIPRWRRSSDPSSSSDSSVAAGWRRSSSREGAATRAQSRSS